MEQSHGFLMPASRQQASCLFQALPPPLLGLLFARGLEQPENFFLARKLAPAIRSEVECSPNIFAASTDCVPAASCPENECDGRVALFPLLPVAARPWLTCWRVRSPQLCREEPRPPRASPLPAEVWNASRYCETSWERSDSRCTSCCSSWAGSKLGSSRSAFSDSALAS